MRAPPCPRTMPSTADMPSPLPVNFVVKNGSNRRSQVALSIPQPVSATCRSANRPACGFSSRRLRRRKASSQEITPVLRVIVPGCFPIASEALMTRFIRICLICPASASITGNGRHRSSCKTAVFESELCNKGSISSIRVQSSTSRIRNRPLPE
ncbi:MAG: hypothetical protein A4E66_02086 [Syntrophus sp. PtaB.Bin001]|nr:MAG: hypothetical protein A4E66_02086 [Syntrophus sp. PtaB.Bin001]